MKTIIRLSAMITLVVYTGCGNSTSETRRDIVTSGTTTIESNPVEQRPPGESVAAPVLNEERSTNATATSPMRPKESPRADLKKLLLGGGHQWSGNPPGNKEDIAALIAATPVALPEQYLELLQLSDGGTAMLSGYPSYVRIWSARTAVEYNRDYKVRSRLPGFIGFGDNGGPDMVGFDTRFGQPYRVCSVTFSSMNWESVMGEVIDFAAFINQLLPAESKPSDSGTATGNGDSDSTKE